MTPEDDQNDHPDLTTLRTGTPEPDADDRPTPLKRRRPALATATAGKGNRNGGNGTGPKVRSGLAKRRRNPTLRDSSRAPS